MSELEAEPYLVMVGTVSPLAPLAGAHNLVFSTVARMPARTVKDYELIIARDSG